MSSSRESIVLTIRVPAALGRRLAREARRQRVTRSEAARVILEHGLAGFADTDLAADARRQSRLAAQSTSEADTLEFIAAAADVQGWR